MWDGDDLGSADKFTVTVMPKKPGAHKIVIIATDLAGAEDFQVFDVMVNNAPVAEGAQTPPKTLEGVDIYSDTTGNGALRVGGIAPPLNLVTDTEGYFSDKDAADTLTCNVVKRGDDIFGAGYPRVNGNGSATVSLALTGTAADLAAPTEEELPTLFQKRGTAHLDVSCTDGFERSRVATLTVKVAFDASIH